MRRPLPLLALPVFAALLLPTASLAGGYLITASATIIVTSEAADGPNSLRRAITNADPGDTVTFHPNLSGKTIRLGGNQLVIDKELTIDGSSLSVPVTISGDATGNGPSSDDSRVFSIANGGFTAYLKSLVISRGHAPLGEGGGGIYIDGSTLELFKCTVSGNHAGQGNVTTSNLDGGHGGGIYNAGGILNIFSSTISGNRAGNGDSNPTTGFAGSGGGICTIGGEVMVIESTVSGNRAGNGGYGGYGGGIYNEGGTLALANSTISGNRGGDTGSVGGSGGGICIAGDGSLTVISSTISGNRAGIGGEVNGGDGGGIFHLDTGDFVSNWTISNSIIAGNATGAGSGGPTPIGADIFAWGDFAGEEAQISTVGPNLIGSNETVESVFPSSSPLVGTWFAPLDPRLGALANNGGPTQTILPLSGSPAINAGNSQYPPDPLDLDQDGDTGTAIGLPSDQRGFARVSGAAPDLGAVEVQPEDAWLPFYNQANFYYAYFASIGQTDTGLAYWFYFRAYGDQAYYRALGNSGYAQFKFYEGLAYFYYTFYKNSAPNLGAYFLYLNFAYAYLDYLNALGNSAGAISLYNTYYALALASL